MVGMVSRETKTADQDKFCDWSCRFAKFPKDKGLDGACQTLQSVYCKKKKCYVLKNKLCKEKK